jgi:hypothetical protein
MVPHPGSRNHIFVDQNEKRYRISRALGAQIPNPGSIARRAKREIFYFCCYPPLPCRSLIGVLLKASYRRQNAPACELDFCGPTSDAICSKCRADFTSGLRPLQQGARQFRFVAPPSPL